MSSYQGFILFLLGVLMGLSIYGISQFSLPQTNTIKYLLCKNKESSISIMVDESKKLITVDGEIINADKLRVFTDYKIFAEWDHNKGSTTVNIDRLTGILELIDKGKYLNDERYQKFDCTHVTQKF